MTPLSFPMPSSITLVLALAWGGAGYYAGDYNRNNAWLAKQVVAERQERENLQAALARGDALSTGLLNQQDEINQLKTEKRDALTLASTGRPCLGSAALRLLNNAPGIRVKRLPAPTSSPAATSEPAAAAGSDDAGYSTDTQAALWVLDAGAQFEVCRARLNALIDWHTHDY